MNFKTKAIGLLAGSALALSVATGAMAETTSKPVTATLSDAGTCSFEFKDTSGGLGNWTWTGTGWVADSSGSTATLNATIQSGNPSGCDVKLSFDGLFAEGNTSGPADIGLSNFTGIYGLDSAKLDSAGLLPWGGTNVESGDYSVGLRLDEVPDDLMPGTYSGTVTAEFGNTQ